MNRTLPPPPARPAQQLPAGRRPAAATSVPPGSPRAPIPPPPWGPLHDACEPRRAPLRRPAAAARSEEAPREGRASLRQSASAARARREGRASLRQRASAARARRGERASLRQRVCAERVAATPAKEDERGSRDEVPRRGARIPVDPRFRRRWVEARRQEGRRRLKALLAGAGSLALVGMGYAALHSSVFAVKDVIVVGAHRTSVTQLEEAAGILTPGGGRQLMVDAGSAASVRAVEALPWIGTVSFHRHWPWTLVVRVTERTPVAVVEGAAGASDIVDATGRSLDEVPAGEPVPTLPVIRGVLPVAPGQHVLPGRGVPAGQLPALLASAAAAARVPTLTGVQLSWSAGQGLVAHAGGWPATVVLGNASQAAEKFAVLQELASTAPLAQYSQVDLTVPGHPALTPLRRP